MAIFRRFGRGRQMPGYTDQFCSLASDAGVTTAAAAWKRGHVPFMKRERADPSLFIHSVHKM